ncbi:MAG: ribosome maturation factor RimP [Eubacteriales bacterium]|nr:ribosome maturation factor RimP [Bacillota bacterium]MBV1727429.1 ribosome maturation factor RimP [Desulforudis sp.]MDP3051331.1 ribosome maturation factor RimP [Eubacteriales bacterium]MBU4532903.1 ribosome maturation factor RimP [Bacillota bacterium]MBU4553814.1 ribosome maturation factor RimP [Bacillota bacterium]
MGNKRVADTVATLTEAVYDNHHVEPVEIEYVKEGDNWYLRIYIDKPEGITLDDCQAVSRDIDEILDAHEDIFPHTYFLEVSSPGAERPLKNREDYIRFAGHLITVKTYTPLNGCKKFTGVLQHSDDNGVLLRVSEEDVSVPWENLAAAKLALEI